MPDPLRGAACAAVSALLWLQPAQAAPAPEAVLAKVGDRSITVQEYAMALRSEAKRRFYHAKPPEDVLAKFRREVADQLVVRALAVQEAGRRGLRPDRAAIDKELDKAKARAKAAGSEHDGKAFVAALKSELEQQSLVGQLRQKVDAAVRPDEAAVQGYYRAHPEKFTEPARVRVSVILLKVAPSAPQPAWTAATDEARRIAARIKAGGDFAELARVHSADKSSANGGDMGYVHQGMLGTPVEQALEKLAPGQITEPITVLEGVALFRLQDRQKARLVEYAQVRARARELLLKQEQELAWTRLVDRLRASTNIRIEEKYLAPG